LKERGKEVFGTINYFNQRGFGFIRTTEDAEDLYFHVSEYAGDEADLIQGAKVEFHLGVFKGKPCARNIRLLPVDHNDGGAE
jgi:cold shock CspA family protein